MDTGRQALVLFFAIFWAIVLAGANRYHAFETSALWTPIKALAARRILVAVFFLNALPALLFYWLYSSVFHETKNDPVEIAAAAVASLSVFGFTRLFHAVVRTDCVSCFYPEYDRKEFEKDPRPGWNSFWGNLIPGLVYILVIPAFAYYLVHRNPLVSGLLIAVVMLPLIVLSFMPPRTARKR